MCAISLLVTSSQHLMRLLLTNYGDYYCSKDLAVIVAITSGHTAALENIGLPSIEALNGGFDYAFIVGAIISVIATAVVVIGLKMRMKLSTEKTIAES
jgi:hypothetical protein